MSKVRCGAWVELRMKINIPKGSLSFQWLEFMLSCLSLILCSQHIFKSNNSSKEGKSIYFPLNSSSNWIVVLLPGNKFHRPSPSLHIVLSPSVITSSKSPPNDSLEGLIPTTLWSSHSSGLLRVKTSAKDFWRWHLNWDLIYKKDYIRYISKDWRWRSRQGPRVIIKTS